MRLNTRLDIPVFRLVISSVVDIIHRPVKVAINHHSIIWGKYKL